MKSHENENHKHMLIPGEATRNVAEKTRNWNEPLTDNDCNA